MGNQTSREQIVDGGKLKPFNLLYPNAPQDYDQQALKRAILERRLSPFYLGSDSIKDVVGIPKSVSVSSLPNQKGSLSNFKQLKRNITTNTQQILEQEPEPVECPICFLVLISNSIIPEISIIRVVVNSQFVPIALFKSNEMTKVLIRQNVHIAFNRILV